MNATLKQFTCILAAAAMACAANAGTSRCKTGCRVLHPDQKAVANRIAAKNAQTPDRSAPPVSASIWTETTNPVNIDILLAYDISSRQWLAENGKGTPDEHAQREISRINTVLANSNISEFRFRLTGTVCFDADASQVRNTYGVDFETILTKKIVDPGGVPVATGEWRKIVDERTRLSADIVCVAIQLGSTTGEIGLGYALDNGDTYKYSQDYSQITEGFGPCAYNIFSIDANEECHAMLHEIGHAMGCGHPDGTCANRDAMIGDSKPGPQLFNYSSGFYTWIDGTGYYTIMGYNIGGLQLDRSYDATYRFTQLPYFSSPDLKYQGASLGTAINDNCRTLLTTYPYVAQYGETTRQLMENGELKEEPLPVRDRDIEFRPAKAINGAPYVGAITQGGMPVGIISLKCAKASVKGKNAGTSKVVATVTGLDGKKSKSRPVYVTCGHDAEAKFDVKGWGAFTLNLDGKGLSGALGDGRQVISASVGGLLPDGKYGASIDANTTATPAGTLQNLLPTATRPELFAANGGKWKFAKPAPIKYKKTKDKTTGTISYQLQGTDDSVKTNLSAMKLTYAYKTGVFKGSFKIYSLVNSKLKKHTVKITGFIVDNVGYGTAAINKKTAFPVSISTLQTEGSK